MNRVAVLPSCLAALLLAASPAFAASAADSSATTAPVAPAAPAQPGSTSAGLHDPAMIQWQPVPPLLPQGAQIAVLDGDPFQPGPYVIRLQLPAGYQIPPHWHSQAENVTVISGRLSFGLGDSVDESAAQTIETGGFHSIPAQTHHYAYSKEGAVVQVHGEGPFDITYVNPADDPRGQ